MSHSSKVFKLLPDWYQDFADAVAAGKPFAHCLETLITQMQAREQLVFCQQLTYENYCDEIEALKAYCELVCRDTPQLVNEIEACQFAFQKDYVEWQWLDQALTVIKAHEKMVADNYFVNVRLALLQVQQVMQGTLSLADWLKQFTAALQPSANTTKIEHKQLIKRFKKIIMPLIQAWHDHYAAHQHENIEAPESADNSFARSFFKVGAVLTMLAQAGRAAGMQIVNVQTGNENKLSEQVKKAQTLPVTAMNIRQAAPQTISIQKTTITLQDSPKPTANLPYHYLNPTVIKSNMAVLTSLYQLGASYQSTGFPVEKALANHGLQPVPKQIIKHHRVHESKELWEDNYYFVEAAVEEPFSGSSLSHEMIRGLYQDINYSADVAANVIEDLLASKKSALFHVAYGYMYGNELLSINNSKAAEWAKVAADAGNILAIQYLAERLYPEPDRSYEMLIPQILTEPPTSPAALAAAKRDFKKTSEKLLKVAAFYGYCRASEMLGRAYLYGYFGQSDAAKALHYYVQAIVQAPDDARHYPGAINAALERLTQSLSWNTFDADAYLEMYEKNSKAVKTLSAVTALAEELMTKRVLAQQHRLQMEDIAAPSKQIDRDTVIRCRAALHAAKNKLQALTLQLDTPHVLPSRATLEAFGVRFGKPSVEGTQASLKLADQYSQGAEQNLKLASYFCRQALKQNTDAQLVLTIMSKQIAIDEKRLQLVMKELLIIGNNPFRVDDVMVEIHQIADEKTSAYGIQIPVKQRPKTWSARYIGKQQEVAKNLLNDLERDTKNLEPLIRDEYQRIHSALRDGDFSGLPRVLDFYLDHPVKRNHWVQIAATYGHISSLREWGQMSIGGNLIEVGIEKTAMAAALGDAKATYDMMRLVENNKLDSAALGITKERLIAYYRSQCYSQNPKLALQLLTQAQSKNAMQAAVFFNGYVRHAVQEAELDLHWNPIERNGSDDIMNELFAMLAKHHSDEATVNQFKKAFSEGSQTCFMQIAQYYADAQEVKSLNQPSKQLLSIVWAAMGLRVGDIASAMHIHRTMASFKQPFPLSRDIVELFYKVHTSIYEWKEAKSADEDISFNSKILTLVNNALKFAASYGDAAASAELAEQFMGMDTFSELQKLGAARIMMIQAITQGMHTEKMYYRYCESTLHQLEVYLDYYATASPDNLRYLEMHELGFKKMRHDVKAFIHLYEMKVKKAHLAAGTTDTAAYKVDMDKMLDLHSRLQALSSKSLIKPFEEAGVRVVGNHHLFDNMIRKHEPWEIEDMFPANRAKDFTLAGQFYLRSMTMQRLMHVTGDYVLEKLRNNMLEDPADMLQLRNLCLKEKALLYAEAWLTLAVRTGSVVAQRIKLLAGNYTHAQMAELSLHGDSEAAQWLAESKQTEDHHRQLLLIQSKQKMIVRNGHSRKLYSRDSDTEKLSPETEAKIHLYKEIIVNILMYALLLVPLFLMRKLYNGYTGRKTQRKQQHQKMLDDATSLFGSLNCVSVKFHEPNNQFIASMQGDMEQSFNVHGFKPTQENQFTCTAEENTAQVSPLLEAAKIVLKQAGIIDDLSITKDKLFEVLQIKRRMDKQKSYHYVVKPHDHLRVELSYTSQCELFVTYASFAGYVVMAGADNTYLLNAKTTTTTRHDQAHSFICKALWNALLNQKKLVLEKELTLKKQKKEAESAQSEQYNRALASLNKYSATAKSLLNEVESLRQTMTVDKHKSAKDILLLCDALKEKLLTCDVMKESKDKENTIAFEKGLTTALKLLDENHPLRVKLINERNKRTGKDKETSVVKPLQYDGKKRREKLAEKKQNVVIKEVARATVTSAANEAASTHTESAVTSVQQHVVSPKVIPVIDPDKVDFSQMLCLPAKEKVTLFKSRTTKDYRPVAKPMPDLLLKIWPMDWLNRHRDVLGEILKDPAFAPDTCKGFRLRALSFRLMELLLFLDKLNEKNNSDETNVSADIKNKTVKFIAKRLLNALRHNAHLITIENLESCVSECVLPNMHNMTTMLTAVSESPLYKKIVPPKGDIIIPRTDDALFADLAIYFAELKALDALFSKLRMDKKNDDACLDAYRGVMMQIGEVGQRLWHKCPQLKNEIIKRYPRLTKLMYFIVVSHVMHRNKYSHHMDLNAMYETTKLKFPFVVDELHGLILERVAARGIKVGCRDGMLASFKKAFLEVEARKEEQALLSEKEQQDETAQQSAYLDIIQMFDEAAPVNNNNDNNAVTTQRLKL